MRGRKMEAIPTGDGTIEMVPKPRRRRDIVQVELKPVERAKIERMVMARGERATMAGVFRELLANAKE